MGHYFSASLSPSASTSSPPWRTSERSRERGQECPSFQHINSSARGAQTGDANSPHPHPCLVSTLLPASCARTHPSPLLLLFQALSSSSSPLLTPRAPSQHLYKHGAWLNTETSSPASALRNTKTPQSWDGTACSRLTGRRWPATKEPAQGGSGDRIRG